MSIFTLINHLTTKGIEIRQEKGQLKLKAPKGALTPELREQLVTNKAEIIGFLQEIDKTGKHTAIKPVSRIDADGREINTFPLSYAQERLWFIDQFEQGQAGYNIPMAVSLHGKLDIAHLEQAFQLIIHRHENLRTIFPSQNGQATQVVVAQLNFTLECVDLSDCSDDILRREDAKQRCQAEAATPFDLASGPLLRGKVIQLSDEEHVLMLTMHHIISDGWSSGVMMNEFSQIMQCLQAGREPALAPLPIQYLDYSVWQRKLLDEEGLLNKQLAYWQNKLAGVP
ncbi:condensation domain-containing protein, partial [Marinibactrum halimedae]